MSGTRPLRAFEPQFQALRNLLDLARDMASREGAPRIGLQLVSSIGVVGLAEGPRVREQRFPLSAAMPIGYCEAKWVCERWLEETLHKHHSEHFRTMIVRRGQIAGSSRTGFWNPVEHFAFLVKSAQSLQVWPDFDGVLQWVPVDKCARAIPWKEMSPVLADALGIPPCNIIPFREWCKRVRSSPLSTEAENPAKKLIDFLYHNFERMSCGGLILDTAKAQEHSPTMAGMGPVGFDIARRYVASWKDMGYIHS
ncbi:hypothetical protein M406DRAFT_343524 [Cryphonectria parasitica EP155]|uniref:Thioester reductase (TE) domain-containing protein n=1 Tax=Cryphonectria parasitica (strain ATCC 38755 / EP155) TaxID=660469 RepID=A0A9P5CJS3_CRYP1|nr:uncharacterized protein M406DRAFT_343524 [Cryphonectria parasitica EP155]KAF3760427.1 hypothetical protein M406DRAFT_343524 [Cryphonectria parasitica EP155]